MSLPPISGRRNSIAPVDDPFANAAVPSPLAPLAPPEATARKKKSRDKSRGLQEASRRDNVAINMPEPTLSGSSGRSPNRAGSEDGTVKRRLSGGGPKLNVRELSECLGDVRPPNWPTYSEDA